MIYELNHYNVVVKDLEKSMAFYQDYLGGKVVFRGFIPPTQTDVIYLYIAGGLVELLHRKDPPADEIFGITHIAFMSNDLDSDFERLVNAGFEGLVKPKTAGSGVGRLAFVRGPNGARVELLQRDVEMRKEVYYHPFVKSFDHISLICNDLNSSVDFYQNLFGMTSIKSIHDNVSKTNKNYLKYDFDILELVQSTSKVDGNDIYAHMAFRVSDVDVALTSAISKGFKADSASRVDPIMSGKIGYATDPDGVKIAFIDRPDLRIN